MEENTKITEVESVTLSFDDKLKIRDKIENLTDIEHIEIFKIFKKHNIEFSENNNGIFINIVNVNDQILSEINMYINHLQKVENEINNIEQQKNEFKENFFNDADNE